MNLYQLLRDARSAHVAGDEEAAKAALRAYYEARMSGELAPAVSGDIAALDLVRAISDGARCFERHVDPVMRRFGADPAEGDAAAPGAVASFGPARTALEVEP